MYIGRPSKWGNPFSHQDVEGKFRTETREEAIEMYRKFLDWRINTYGTEVLIELAELDGAILGCWCAPKPCHGDVLVEFARKAKQTLYGT